MAAVADCVERIAAGEIFQANLCLRLEAELRRRASPTSSPTRCRSCSPPTRPASSRPGAGSRASRRSSSCAASGRDGDDRADQGHRAAQRRPRRAAALREGPRRARDDRRPDAQRPRARRRVRERRGARRAPRRSRTPGVWHLVSEVRARLAPGNGDAALLRATFPPGSVTGAPKVQAMKVIAALEATGREVYTGAIGYASPHAGLELNVAIRTFEAHAGHLWLGVGGGIVADSDPEAELEECLVKARPLVDAHRRLDQARPVAGRVRDAAGRGRGRGQPRRAPRPPGAQRQGALRRDAAADRAAAQRRRGADHLRPRPPALGPVAPAHAGARCRSC